jgi:hypothetical protein
MYVAAGGAHGQGGVKGCSTLSGRSGDNATLAFPRQDITNLNMVAGRGEIVSV